MGSNKLSKVQRRMGACCLDKHIYFQVYSLLPRPSIQNLLMMELRYFLNLVILFVVNIQFFFSGLCLNTLVIISFWRSAQLRKKLCYFMIMVLSCFDLISVLTNHPVLAYIAIHSMTENKTGNRVSGLRYSAKLSAIFVFLSSLVLLVMNFDRYLATYHPIFHRTTVTKRRLVTILAIMVFVFLVLLLSVANCVVSYQVAVLVFLAIYVSPMLYVNCKLLIIAEKNRKRNRMFAGMRKTFSLKNVSSCLLAVACLVTLSIPAFVAAGLRINSNEKGYPFDVAYIVALWAQTICSMNGTFNCLIFYWKNAALRTEGIKVIESMKIK